VVLYRRITNPRFLEQDNDGRPAAGYLVYTLVAGTVDTLADTYSDVGLTALNTNPIVLDIHGEATIFSTVDLKLVYTAPDGDLTSPIWTEDYYGNRNTNFVTGEATPVTVGNNYVVTTVPAITSLLESFMLIMIPDVDNIDTIVSTVFTGTGSNDLTASGPYVGSTPGSIFSLEIDTTVQAPPIAPTAVLSGDAGSVIAGNHYVKMTAVTADGETVPGDVSALVVGDDNHAIDVSDIPALAGEITGYNLYMTEAGGTTYYLVNTTPITDTTYQIDIMDVVLVTHAEAPTENTTGAGSADTFKWRKDGGAWTEGVVITSEDQILIEGVTVVFASLTGHVFEDTWAITVMTPARVNLDGLGNMLIYKNKGGEIVPLDGGDMKSGYPALLLINSSLTGWLLTNPASPVVSAPTISAIRYRKNLVADYDIVYNDQGKELSCVGTFRVTLPPCPEFANRFVYVRNTGNGVITIDAGGYLIKGYGSVAGRTTITLARTWECVQLATDGVDWHILAVVVSPVASYNSEGAGPTGGLDIYSTPGVYYWTCPAGITAVSLSCTGGGGGGGGATDSPYYGWGGTGGITDTDLAVVVTPGQVYTVTVGAGGAGGPGTQPAGTAGSNGGASSFDALCSGAGGAGGLADTATEPQSHPVSVGGGWGGHGTYGGPGTPGAPGEVKIAY
jgi:hypothetical protein